MTERPDPHPSVLNRSQPAVLVIRAAELITSISCLGMLLSLPFSPDCGLMTTDIALTAAAIVAAVLWWTLRRVTRLSWRMTIGAAVAWLAYVWSPTLVRFSAQQPECVPWQWVVPATLPLSLVIGGLPTVAQLVVIAAWLTAERRATAK